MLTEERSVAGRAWQSVASGMPESPASQFIDETAAPHRVLSHHSRAEITLTEKWGRMRVGRLKGM